ncbi:MAG TPA: pantoate--beta-alanine ligase [Planctomycetota bacterium]|nr:pantoate--beta-alanine ligase [Planctomycetota bacterium]
MLEPVVIENPDEMHAWSRGMLAARKSLGLVPTMGALHAGHRSLIERARRENDAVTVSIYVNPTQFGPGEDLDRYPRTFDGDKNICADAGVDCIFAPTTLYAQNARTFVEVIDLQDQLCGISRPSHFRGVATVVAKLFNIVQPTRAYFGQKDAQQLLIIETMVRDLNFAVQIVPCEIVREPDGLALSSRNRYLSPKERKLALAVPRALDCARAAIKSGERDAMKLLGNMANILAENDAVEIDYCALVDAHTLEDLKTLKGDVLAAVAVKIGKTRLIDNARFERL